MKTQKLLFMVPLLIAFSTGYGQDSTQTERNKNLLSSAPGNTKMLLTGSGFFGFYVNKDKDAKFNFNAFRFAPVFLWKISDKLFFESELELDNGEFALEFTKLSFVLNKYMTLGAGQMLTPFGAYGERFEPPLTEKFPNTPIRPKSPYLPGSNHLVWGAVMGMDVRGGIPLGSAKMNYSLFLDNGPSLDKSNGMVDYENFDDNNTNKEIGGRIGLLPFSNSSLEIGFSGRYGIAGDQGDLVYGKIGATAYAVDLSYVKSIEAIKSTINIRGQFNTLTVDKANYYLTDSTTYTFDNTMQNYYMQFSIRPTMAHSKCLKKTELMFRYNAITAPQDAVWAAKDNNGKGGTITRIDIGLVYWLNWRTGLRFAYEITSNPNGKQTKEILARFVMGF
ncbi:MAG: hypothetical protein D4R64_10785 [Porphyromonadaceae bacterium]|nr:MAG: hypothetical protein D4R64_10785 [Porphyromonadaceae bacterium]